MSISMRRRPSPSKRRRPSDKANDNEASAGLATLVGPSEQRPADLIVELAAARNEPKGMLRHAARPRRHRRLSAGASMSRCCARKAPRTQRPRASGSCAAQPMTARGGQSQSSACRALSKRRPPPRPGRNAPHVRTRASAAGAHLMAAPAPAGASLSGPSEGAPAKGARDRRVRRVGVGPRGQAPGEQRGNRASAASTVLQREAMAIAETARNERGAPTVRRANASSMGLRAGRVHRRERASRHDLTTRATPAQTSNQDPRVQERATGTGRRVAIATRAAMPDRRANASLTGLRVGRAPHPERADRRDRTTGVGRASVASTVPKPTVTVIVEMDHHERAASEIPDANAGLIDLRVERLLQPARVDRRDLRTRAGARAPISNQECRAQARVTEIGRRAAARAAKADLRAVALRRRGGALPRGKDRRKAPVVHGARRGSRDQCESSAAASRAAIC
jgi:hypothetical protein